MSLVRQRAAPAAAAQRGPGSRPALSAVSAAWSAVQVLVHRVGAGVAWALVLILRAYQLVISPLYGPTCRFYPSCSSYAVQALQIHGPIRGLWLIARRLARCNPWNRGGVDDVPPKATRHQHPHA